MNLRQAINNQPQPGYLIDLISRWMRYAHDPDLSPGQRAQWRLQAQKLRNENPLLRLAGV